MTATTGGRSDIGRERKERNVTNHEMIGDLWGYMKSHKKLWLLPIIVVLGLVGALLVFAQGSALAPFIYTLF